MAWVSSWSTYIPLHKIKETEENIQNLTKEVQLLNDDKNRIKEEIEKTKNSLYTQLWLFASVITFISVEIQILKTTCSNFSLAWLSFITLWWLVIFVILIDHIWRGRWEEEKKKIAKMFLEIAGLIFLVGIILISFWNEQQCKENEIYQKFENEYWKKIIELENKIDHKNDFFWDFFKI